VPTNQQRREAAKRKLQRQLQRREEQDRARRQRLVIIGVVAAVLVISGGVWLFVSRGTSSTASDANSSTAADATDSAASEPTTPCSYPAAGTAAKDVTVPTNLEPLNSGTVDSTIVLNGQDVPVSLNRAIAPCGVNSFLSLASQGFYDNTSCHRLTVSAQLNILQCGDPSGKGNGGPGYSFATEAATDATYPVGTVALANAGADTNGSQFFIVYGSTTLPASYTILGTVSGDGMKVVDEIAAQGVQNGAQDGPPVATTEIAKVTVPGDALEGTGTYETATPSDQATDGLSTGGLDTGAVDTGAVDTGAVDTGAVDTGAATPTPTAEVAPTAEATAAETTGGAG
jgi:peptidyl-prolyl cis-trans isomerase B (cyclophilin B)